MTTFQTPQIIHIPRDVKECASEFANAVTDTVNSKDCNQSVVEKIRDDHFVSKLGEEAKRKSWAADIKVNGLDIAVKTQRRSAANRARLSWTFQDSPVRRDPILDMANAWVCLVVFEDLKSETECLVYP